MLIVCEGMDKCGKSSFLKNLGLCVYEGNAIWGADTSQFRIDDNYPPITTLDHFLQYEGFNENIALHFDNTDAKPHQTTIKCIKLAKKNNVFLDRSWISELCYGPVYRGISRLDNIEHEDILEYLSYNSNYQILWFDRKLSNTYFKALDKNNKFECDYSKVKAVHNNYTHLMNNYKKQGLNVMKINYGVK